MRDKAQIHFCLKAIVLWEALADKSYQLINLQDEEDVLRLLYAMYLSGGGQALSLELFAESVLVSERVRHQLIQEAVRQISLQTSLSPKRLERDEPTQLEEHPSEPAKLSPLIARLIVEGGISAEYVMYQMGLWELPLYLQAIEDKRNEQMERERLWCYLNLSPHIDHKKVKTPRDLIPLPHERIEKDTEVQKQAELYELLAARWKKQDEPINEPINEPISYPINDHDNG